MQRSYVIIEGMEFTVEQRISRQITMRALYLLNFDIRDSTENILKRPERMADVGVNLQILSGMDFSAQANYIGTVRDFSYPTGQ